MAKNSIENLVDELAQDIERLRQTVAAGSCDAGEYKYMCGQIRGLLLAQDKVKSLLQQMREPDDD
jgi:hypothetical protein